jgi:hypothetical protein
MTDFLNNDLASLLSRKEALNPNLRPYIRKGPLGQMLNHPLVQEIIYREEMNALYNERYKHKVESLAEAIDKKKWHTVLFLHERPYRLDALLQHHRRMSDEEYWSCVGSVWVDSENIWQAYPVWRDLWESPRPGKHLVMDEAEQAAMAALPDSMKVYRGVHGKGVTKVRKRTGLSWTLDKDKAEWFANRYQQSPQKVLEGIVKKSDVHAHFTARNENEIVATKVIVP